MAAKLGNAAASTAAADAATADAAAIRPDGGAGTDSSPASRR